MWTPEQSKGTLTLYTYMGLLDNKMFWMLDKGTSFNLDTNTPQRCWMGLRSRLCACQTCSFTKKLQPFLNGPCFVHGDNVMLKTELSLPQTLKFNVPFYQNSIQICLNWN